MSDAKVTFQDENFNEAAPGAEVFFSFACPKMKGRTCAYLLIRDTAHLGQRPSWIWSGGRDAPTFEPSINHKSCWHGYIEKGRCVTAAKSDEPEPT